MEWGIRATAASRLYHQNVDEQLICERTGHRSNSVRSYKSPCDNQLKEVSNILHGNISNNESLDNRAKHSDRDIRPKFDVCATPSEISVNINLKFSKLSND